MEVPAIAVTGASGLVGQRLLPLLVEHPDVTRVVALDVREPGWHSRNLEFHRVDIAGTDLKPLFEGIDTVVHLAGVVDPIADEALMARGQRRGHPPGARGRGRGQRDAHRPHLECDGLRRVAEQPGAAHRERAAAAEPSLLAGGAGRGGGAPDRRLA